MAIPGGPLALVAGGAVLVYSGVENTPVADVFRTLSQGKTPQPGPLPAGPAVLASPAGGTITSQGGQPAGTDKTNQALGRVMAAARGWTGDQWTALDNIAMAESGWSDTIENPGSGAAGIAQNIAGFGPGYQSGNAAQQITWMLRYIKARYGDPAAAWQFHLANGWY